MSESVFLAFDFGTRRIGVAIANDITRAARPLTVVERDGDARWQAIAALLAQWKPQQLVVGRPTQADGTEDIMTARAERFARQLHGRFRLPVALVDERYSSAVVEGGADDAAAAVILQQWLDSEASPFKGLVGRGMGLVSDSSDDREPHPHPFPLPLKRRGKGRSPSRGEGESS